MGGACSYTARKGEVQLGGGVSRSRAEQKIFVPIFDNLTVRTGFEAVLTNAIRNALVAVRGVDVVNDSADAHYFLFGTILDYSLRSGRSRLGNEASQLAGGLAKGQSTAHDFNLKLRIQVRLVEKIADSAVTREIWSREFDKSATFEASNRLEISGVQVTSGAQSAPLINDSREQIQFKSVAESLAQQVLDQVVQDF